MSLRADLTEDFARYTTKPATLGRLVKRFFSHAGFRATALYRISRRSQARGSYRIAGLAQRVMFHTCYCEISAAAEIGAGLMVSHTVGLVVGGGTRLGRQCDIRQNITFGGNFNKTGPDGRTQPWVGDGVSIGAGAVLVGPIRIGDGAIIGANSVVTADVADHMIAAGVPAREIKRRWDLDSGRQL